MVFPSEILPTIEETERMDPTARLSHKGSNGVKEARLKTGHTLDTIYVTFWKSQNYRNRKQICQALGLGGLFTKGRHRRNFGGWSRSIFLLWWWLHNYIYICQNLQNCTLKRPDSSVLYLNKKHVKIIKNICSSKDILKKVKNKLKTERRYCNT